MGAPLTKLRSVCSWDGGTAGYVKFSVEAEPGEFNQRAVYISTEDWADMGGPTVVTLTVEPGDQLNTE